MTPDQLRAVQLLAIARGWRMVRRLVNLDGVPCPVCGGDNTYDAGQGDVLCGACGHAWAHGGAR